MDNQNASKQKTRKKPSNRLRFGFSFFAAGLVNCCSSNAFSILFRGAAFKLRFLDVFILTFSFVAFYFSWRQNNHHLGKNKNRLERKLLFCGFHFFLFKKSTNLMFIVVR